MTFILNILEHFGSLLIKNFYSHFLAATFEDETKLF